MLQLHSNSENNNNYIRNSKNIYRVDNFFGSRRLSLLLSLLLLLLISTFTTATTSSNSNIDIAGEIKQINLNIKTTSSSSNNNKMRRVKLVPARSLFVSGE